MQKSLNINKFSPVSAIVSQIDLKEDRLDIGVRPICNICRNRAKCVNNFYPVCLRKINPNDRDNIPEREAPTNNQRGDYESPPVRTQNFNTLGVQIQICEARAKLRPG